MKIIKDIHGNHYLMTGSGDGKGRNIQRIINAVGLIMTTVAGVGVAAMLAQMFGIMIGVIDPN